VLLQAEPEIIPLGYFAIASTTQKKSFITLMSGMNVLKLFSAILILI
jgi:hypothetical protein